MIDVSYFQTNNANTQIFQNGDTWQTWIKPRNAKIVSFFVQGAGSGGGGGFQTGSGTKSGGAGGSNGGVVKLIVQASLLPDILYILPGTGGAGGIGGNPSTSGSNATKSFVCLTPNTSSASNIVCTSGNAAAQGAPGGSNVNAAGAVAESIALASNMIFANLGNFLATAGGTGANATTSSGGVNSMNSFASSGGGGGQGNTGGGLNGGGPVPTVSSISTGNGSDGLIFYKPIFGVTGGRGAGGGTTGGKGGNGAPGTGGGGGGAGTVSAGNGGNGGDGFIIVTTNF